MRPTLFAAFLTACLLPAGAAWAEPPITSARDAACRDEARAKVFTAPDPEGLGLYEKGRRIYFACMGSAKAGKAPGRTASAGAQ